MIILIIKCYFLILLSITVGALFILFGGLFLIFRKRDHQVVVCGAKETSAKERTEIVSPNPESHSTSEASVITQNSLSETAAIITSQDIDAIAGDDTIATQLDLARAYIESDRRSLAKKILENVVEFGKLKQQKEAQNLLASLNNKCSE